MSMSSPHDFLQAGIPLAHLKIGECIVSTRPLLVSTVLGSCVSATFFHPSTGAGAIFHAMLPTLAMARNERPCCKFVDSSLQLVVMRLTHLGIPLREIECKLFGGGFTIQPELKGHLRNLVDVGRKNVEVARAELARLGFSILAEDVLGHRGRKLFFATHTGTVWMRYVSCGAIACSGR